MLRKGGSPQGIVMEDSQSLADCGLTSSMDIFEHLWVDSAANQAAFRAEYETVRRRAARVPSVRLSSLPHALRARGGGRARPSLLPCTHSGSLRRAQMAGFVKTHRDLLDATTNE